jgi:hypothetical protein
MIITTKKRADKIYVYDEGELMWVKNLTNPLKSWGATNFRQYAEEYINKRRNSNEKSRVN